MSLRAAAEELVARAAALGQFGRTLSHDDWPQLVVDIPLYPAWLVDLLSAVPLCGLMLGWQAYPAEPGFDGVIYVEVSDANGVRSESLECYPGVAILSAGYLNFGSDDSGSGDPYYIDANAGTDPPLYQVYHDAGAEAGIILAEGRRVVSPSLSDFFRLARLHNTPSRRNA